MEFIIDRSVQKVIGMIIGFLIIWLGYKLFRAGVSGEASLIAQRGKLRFQIVNAAPGIFFALFGFGVIVFALWQKEFFKYENGKLIEITKDLKEESEFSNYYDIGMLLAEKERFDGALFCFEQAFESLPDLSKLYNNMAYLYALENKDEDLDRAIILSRMSLLIRPKEPRYYETLAELLSKKGDTDQAVGYIEKAVELDPQNRDYKDKLDQLK